MKSKYIPFIITAALALSGCAGSFDTEVIMTVSKQSQEETEHISEPETKGELLTVEKILELSDKEDLDWKDFERYASRDIGSGLMILEYEMVEPFRLAIGGPGKDKPPMYIHLESLEDKDFIDIRTDDVNEFINCHSCTVNYVGIKGHIKEIHEDQALICSDTEDYPGVFWVLGAKELAVPEEWKGGTSVYVLMRELKDLEKDGIKKYRAEKFFAIPKEDDRGIHDILLTDMPALELTDVLSSTYDSFQIQPENYTWNSNESETGEGFTMIACGAAPLDEAACESRAVLKLPRYQGVDSVGYSFSTKIQPDKLMVRQWSAEDIGNPEAKEESVSTYYYVIPFLDLKPGKVYEFTAEWKKENQDQYQFSGIANYVLVTE